MKKILFLIFIVFLSQLLMAADDPEGDTETGIKTDKGGSYIQSGELYPYIIVENKPLSAARGNIYGTIKEDSLISAMTKLAAEYDLAGWIKKMPDGSMRFHLQGIPDNVKEAVSKIPQCDPASKINNVETKAAVATKYMTGFRRIENE